MEDKLLAEIIANLKGQIDGSLVDRLISEYFSFKRDVFAGSYTSSAGGRFCEVALKCIQHLEAGVHEEKISVELVCRRIESSFTRVPHSLRIEVPRAILSVYAIRNHRSVHSGSVDPNYIDCMFALAGVQ